MLKVLFVCTGNVFRSYTGEYCLKDYLKKHNIHNIYVSSAGTVAKSQKPSRTTLDQLKKMDVRFTRRIPRKLTQKMVNDFDVILPMAKNHQDLIRKKFGRTVPLFNQYVFNKNSSIWDVQDEVPKWKTNRVGMQKYIRKTTKKIFKGIPQLVEQINSTTLLFQNFVDGKVKHRNGFPFIPLYETKHSLAFMSIDIPQKEDGHVLVIPKKRYSNLEKIPKVVQDDLMRTISFVGKALMKTHEGYNVLLNNGHSAGQYVYHTHFHVIPRNKDDDIKIEIWKNKKMTEKEFVQLNKKLKKEINRTVNS